MELSNKVLVTIAQIDIKLSNLDYNFEKISKVLEDAASVESDLIKLVIFPECALTGYCFDHVDELLPIALKTDEYLKKILKKCESLNVYSIVGYVEHVDDSTFHNSAKVLCPSGKTFNYRKVHLPCMGVDALEELQESEDGFPVFDLGFMKLGITICFDHGFPESSRALALNDAEVIVSIVNWAEGLTGDKVVQARAIDNGVPYIAVNRVGDEKLDHFVGKSMAVDETGEIIVSLEDEEKVVSFILPLTRDKGRFLAEHPMNKRRPDQYFNSY